MNESNIKEILSETVCRVMEQTAFVFPEPIDLSDGIGFDDYDMLAVNLSFNGDSEGDMSFMVPMELCTEIAANLLGEEDEASISDDSCQDSAKEMLNIIVGQLLTKLYGEKAIFNLTPPEVRPLTKDELFAEVDDKPYACFMADDYPIIITFQAKDLFYEHKSTSS